MKTKIFLFAVLFTAALTSNAQMSIGVQGGVLSSTPKIKQTQIFTENLDPQSAFNWQAGIIADLPLGEAGFRFIPELKFVNKGFKLNSSLSYLGQPASITGKSNIGYIELPVNFGYAFNLGGPKLIVGAGPYVGYGITGKNKFEATVGTSVVNSRDEKITFGNAEGDIKPFDYGANIMAGLLLNNGLMLNLNYSIGMANISNSPDASYKNSYLGASVVFFIKKAGE